MRESTTFSMRTDGSQCLHALRTVRTPCEVAAPMVHAVDSGTVSVQENWTPACISQTRTSASSVAVIR
jgi:hypothetical protein